MARLNPLFCRSGPWRASMRAWFSGSASAVSKGYLLDSKAFTRSSQSTARADRYEDKSPKEALGMFRSRPRRVWGHAAVFAWSDLILDRKRKLAGLQSPAAPAPRARMALRS